MNATKPNPMASLEEDIDDEDQPEADEFATLKPKVSVALPVRTYAQLVEWCSIATRLRGKRVTHVDVFRALAAELFADEELSKRVMRRLRGEKK